MAFQFPPVILSVLDSQKIAASNPAFEKKSRPSAPISAFGKKNLSKPILSGPPIFFFHLGENGIPILPLFPSFLDSKNKYSEKSGKN